MNERRSKGGKTWLAPVAFILLFALLFAGLMVIVASFDRVGDARAKLIEAGVKLEDLTAFHGFWMARAHEFSGTLESIAPLLEAADIGGLDLHGTQVSDLTPLAGLSKLTELWLGNTQAKDLAPLAGLSKLTELDLSFTQVSDLTPLTGLSALTELSLHESQVSDDNPILKQLRNRGVNIIE